MGDSPYTITNEVFAHFLFYGTLTLIKTILMSNVTSFKRIKHKSYCSIEDAKIAAPNDLEKQKRLLRRNEEVERARSAHLNDLENVIPFVLLGLLYVGSNPDPVTALWHFRIFFFARVIHSIVYVNAFRQPFRILSYLVGYICFFSMAYHIISLFYH